jgi:glycerol-3-phosphate dehydrogenase
LKIHGFHDDAKQLGDLAVYGSDAAEIQKLMKVDPTLGDKLHSALSHTKAEVTWAVRQEMAHTIEDVLARRMRALFLNARAALEMAPTVAELMAEELGWNPVAKAKQLAIFRDLAQNYVLAK